MKNPLLPAILLWFAALGCLNVSAQCNSTFNYIQQGSYTYNFTSNQVEQQGYTYNYTWNISGAGTYYTPTVSEDFGVTGDFQVCLKISIQDSLGVTLCTDSSCNVVVSTGTVTQCFPDVQIFTSYYPGTTQVQFSNTLADYTNTTVTWSFGDGNFETGLASPTYTYASYGNYNVCLYLADTLNNCVDTVCTLFTLDSCPGLPGWGWLQPLDGTDSIVFTGYGNPGQQYTWAFGDGDTIITSGDSVFSHIYAGPYPYLVCATTGQGACQASGCNEVIVDSCRYVLDFAYSSSADSLFQVNFYSPGNSGNYNIQGYYYWYLGDGTLDSTYYGFTHTYPGAGTYIACLQADVAGCGVIEHCDTIAMQCNLAASFWVVQTSTNTFEYTPDTIQDFPGINYFWTFGDSATDNNITHPVHVYGQTGDYDACLTVSDSTYGCTTVTYCDSISVEQWADTICGHAWVDANLNGIQDSSEANYQSLAIDVTLNQGSNYYNITLFTDSNGNYVSTVPVNIGFTIGADPSNNAQYSVPGYTGDYYYTFYQDTMTQCGFDFGVVSNYGTIAGVIYDDLDLDGLYDNNDVPIYNQVVDVNGQPAAVSAGANGYRILEPPGTYAISVDPSSYYYDSFPPIPAQLHTTLNNPGDYSVNNNIAIDVPATYNDIGIDIIPTSPLVPNWSTSYFVMLTNYGPNNILDVNFDFNTPAADLLVNPNYSFGGTVVQNSIQYTQQLYPFSGNAGIPYYQVLPGTPINTDIYDTATIVGYPDAIASNNIDTCHQITVSSFDPNNKLTTQSGYGPEGYISKDQTLKYVINFQNTGSSPAINIVVRDVLDPSLDFNTFRFIGAYANSTPDIKISHDTLYFRLIDIELPDSASQPAGSIGWIAYSIKPKSTITGGTQIHNFADVFFDYNTPVRTNTTLHTIEGPTGITDIYSAGQLNISPNPFGAQTNISLLNMPADHYTYKVTDVLGHDVTQGIIRNNQTIPLYRGTMSAGVYIISFYDDSGIVKRARIIAQ